MGIARNCDIGFIITFHQFHRGFGKQIWKHGLSKWSTMG